jgi:hypothetical protein
MSRAIPPPLLTAITAAVPPERQPRLIAEWAITLAENEKLADRIRAQVHAYPHGFLRYAEGYEGGVP